MVLGAAASQAASRMPPRPLHPVPEPTGSATRQSQISETIFSLRTLKAYTSQSLFWACAFCRCTFNCSQVRRKGPSSVSSVSCYLVISLVPGKATFQDVVLNCS